MVVVAQFGKLSKNPWSVSLNLVNLWYVNYALIKLLLKNSIWLNFYVNFYYIFLTIQLRHICYRNFRKYCVTERRKFKVPIASIFRQPSLTFWHRSLVFLSINFFYYFCLFYTGTYLRKPQECWWLWYIWVMRYEYF